MLIARGNRLLAYLAVATIAGSGLIAAARTPAPVKGVTYRVRVSTQMPNLRGGGGGGGGTDVGAPPAGAGGGGFPGGFGGGQTQLVRVAVVGDRAKVEFQVGNPPGSSLTDFYLMLLDSNKTYRVSPDNQTYSDAELAPNAGRGRGGRGGFGGGGGAGGAGGAGAGGRGNRGGNNNSGDNNGRGGRGGGGFVNPMQMLMDAVVTDMKATTEDLGAGEAIDGRPTKHYKITVDYGFKLYGQPKQTKTTTEIWTVDFTGRVVNPFESTNPGPEDSTVSQVARRLVEEAKKIPGTPVKVVTTQVVPISAVGEAEADVSASGAVAQTVNIVRTTLITALKTEDVEDTDLKIPADYKKVQGGFGRGGQ